LQTATYNATLKTVACSGVGAGCDSGPSLLLGRDTLAGGSEPNQPNTINSSCADGTSGTFHSDESNDRLVIQTTDGSTLAPGKTIKVSATVWAYSSFTSDHLDLYYAANASSPTWVLIATIAPTVAGAQTLSRQLHAAERRRIVGRSRAIPLPGNHDEHPGERSCAIARGRGGKRRTQNMPAQRHV
jgi:hypothetical protein